ncbi:MAG: hypothetical protein ABI091_17685 [Ferruginibacter sp.]
MQRSFKTEKLLQSVAVVLLATTLLVACESKDTKITDVKTTDATTVQVKDSLPPLVVDSNTKTKPETIKSTNAAPQPQTQK